MTLSLLKKGCNDLLFFSCSSSSEDGMIYLCGRSSLTTSREAAIEPLVFIFFLAREKVCPSVRIKSKPKLINALGKNENGLRFFFFFEQLSSYYFSAFFLFFIFKQRHTFNNLEFNDTCTEQYNKKCNDSNDNK